MSERLHAQGGLQLLMSGHQELRRLDLLTAWMVRAAQLHTRRQLARHRALLLKREQQLDQQLAFSRRA